MKFTVDIEEFWLEEDEDIESALKAYITHDVIMKISKNIEDKVEREISDKVSEAIKTKLSQVVDNKLTDLLAVGVIKKNSQEIPITEHIKNLFLQHSGWSSPEDYIKKIAQSFGKELKAQYNAAFANQVVIGMKEQGLLKDEVVQILLEPKK